MWVLNVVGIINIAGRLKGELGGVTVMECDEVGGFNIV